MNTGQYVTRFIAPPARGPRPFVTGASSTQGPVHPARSDNVVYREPRLPLTPYH
jgi:hypothetical protein